MHRYSIESKDLVFGHDDDVMTIMMTIMLTIMMTLMMMMMMMIMMIMIFQDRAQLGCES